MDQSPPQREPGEDWSEAPVTEGTRRYRATGWDGSTGKELEVKRLKNICGRSQTPSTQTWILP